MTKLQEAKWVSEEALQRQGRKGKIYITECRVPENSKERQEGFFK